MSDRERPSAEPRAPASPAIPRDRLVTGLLAGSVVPVLVGKFVVPGIVWWLFGLSCLMVVAGSALLLTNGRGGDAS